MSETQVTIPLGIPEVLVLQTANGESGELITIIESTKEEPPVANVGNGSRDSTDEMNG